MEPGGERGRTQSQARAGVGLEVPGHTCGPRAPPPALTSACDQRPGCPGGSRQREPTFHGRVGVWAVGKHHVHVLQLQPL